MKRFALIGNPNSGKTTLFNALTGASAKVGNWPGVTIDKKVGVYKKISEEIQVIDLPGIYSLSPYSPEEIVARDYLLNEKPDLVINIVDVTNLERNLYLTTQILEIGIPVILAFNMIDAIKSDQKIDINKFSAELGVKVYPISALKSTGIDDLMKAAYLECFKKREPSTVLVKTDLLNFVTDFIKMLQNEKLENSLFHAIKFLEGDQKEEEMHPDLIAKATKIKDSYSPKGDLGTLVATKRYEYINSIVSNLTTIKGSYKENKSDRIDKVLTNKWLGIPFFLLIMFLVFHFVFSENFLFLGFILKGKINNDIWGIDSLNSPGVILFNLMSFLMNKISNLLQNCLLGSPKWVSGFVVDGIFNGISSVLSFIPQILSLFFFISILEDSGYMSRAAFVMDRVLRKIGLSGKAFMPLLMCFGCAVPGVMATKILETKRERRVTIMLAPFFSCGAKLPIWGVFGAILWAGQYGDLLVFGMYLLGIITAVLVALVVKLTVMKGKASLFIIELPNYRRPRMLNVWINLWDKFKHYIFRAATVILGSLIIIWMLSSFGFDHNGFGLVEIENSFLGIISKGLKYLFIPLGFAGGQNGYMFIVAAITGLIAKEMVPGTLGLFAGMNASALGAVINSISIPASLAFLSFNLLTIPCVAALGAAKSELKSKKEFWLTILFWFLTSYLVATLIFIGITYWYLGIALIVIIIIFLVFLIIRNKKRNLVNEYADN